MSLLPRRDHRHMTVSRLERPAGRYFFKAPEPVSSTVAAADLARDLGEIGDLIGGGADAGKQRKAVGAHGLILIIHENMLKK